MFFYIIKHMRNFYIHTMGCKSNQFESAIIKENLEKNNLVEVKEAKDADVYIMNSCTVTHKSDNEALYLLRNIKHKNPNVLTVLTGCLAQVEKDRLLEHDFIDYVVGNNEKLDISEILKSAKSGGIKCMTADIMELSEFNKKFLVDMTKTRAGLKIQDGCDNRCAYCIIPFARGKSRSADAEFIINQIKEFEKMGFKEIVFTGIHIGQWGLDIESSLLELLQSVETETDIERYRLGSLNPLEISDEFLAFLAQSKKFCPHFHLSLQSACNKTLKSMNRFYKVEDYLEQIERINKMFDLPFLGSDIITGFAGETDEDFEITRQNLEKSGLSQIHTFPYSIREGTVGASSTEQVEDRIKECRATVVKSISSKKYNDFVQKNLGTVRDVLIEKHLSKKTGNLKGVTGNYLTIELNSSKEELLNTIQKVKITHFENGKIYGELV